ncbi:hypothetical protein, partial [Ochrobactrum sp. SFR4]|uniref:hypothetical protein n=1 Tax=Ochrobactrum sp. SFR4 TaxID=2717368 RepID=UPI001C8B9C55
PVPVPETDWLSKVAAYLLVPAVVFHRLLACPVPPDTLQNADLLYPQGKTNICKIVILNQPISFTDAYCAKKLLC